MPFLLLFQNQVFLAQRERVATGFFSIFLIYHMQLQFPTHCRKRWKKQQNGMYNQLRFNNYYLPSITCQWSSRSAEFSLQVHKTWSLPFVNKLSEVKKFSEEFQFELYIPKKVSFPHATLATLCSQRKRTRVLLMKMRDFFFVHFYSS